MIFPAANLLSSFVPHETTIRSGCFLVIFLVITILESAAPPPPPDRQQTGTLVR